MVYNDWNNDYLAHHGIKGMHWGIRRFQNPDGTLTSAGKERYKGEDTIKEKRELTNRSYELNRKAKSLNKQIKEEAAYTDEQRKALTDELDSVMKDADDVLSKLDDFKEKQANKTLGQKIADLWASEERYCGYRPRDYMIMAGALAAYGTYKITADKIWDKDHSKRDAMRAPIDNTINSGKQWLKTNVTDPIKNSAYAKSQGVSKEDTMEYLTDQFKKGKISEEEFRAQGKSMGLNKRMIEDGLKTANAVRRNGPESVEEAIQKGWDTKYIAQWFDVSEESVETTRENRKKEASKLDNIPKDGPIVIDTSGKREAQRVQGSPEYRAQMNRMIQQAYKDQGGHLTKEQEEWMKANGYTL